MLFPIRLEILDGETVEQFLFAEKICLQSAKEETLAKAAGAGKKIVFTRRHKFVEQLSLVDIKEVFRPKFLEVLDSDREVLKVGRHIMLFLICFMQR